MGSQDDGRVLVVGLVCVDIICVTSSYPSEDSDERALEQYWQRGGNSSNITTVFSHLKTPCEFLGTLAADDNSSFLVRSFKTHGIPIRNCVFHQGCNTPSSIVIISKENGSRTIVGGIRNLPELTVEEFASIDLTSLKYKWIHFEGRPNVNNISQMIRMVEDYNSTIADKNQHIVTSMEFEKKREGIDDLQDRVDYLFVSKDYARLKGYTNKEDAVRGFSEGAKPGSTVICAWGTDGAAAYSEEQTLVTSPCFSPALVMDTLGAGDVFVAATIHSLANNMDIKESITFGCKVAGAKVGMKGFDALKDINISLI